MKYFRVTIEYVTDAENLRTARFVVQADDISNAKLAAGKKAQKITKNAYVIKKISEFENEQAPLL